MNTTREQQIRERLSLELLQSNCSEEQFINLLNILTDEVCSEEFPMYNSSYSIGD